MNKTVCIVFFIVILAGAISCKKDTNNNNITPLEFTELKADDDTLYAGTSTYVRATATGTDLLFQWSATAGDILGSGATVQYAAPPCVSGSHQITCTIKDAGNNTASKTVTIIAL